jgi:phage/conjugal plasmid C-4 type zinc finger TraR family protein
VTDAIDEAQEHEEQLREDALARQRMEAEGGLGGRRICHRCGEAIPTARLRAEPDAVECYDCRPAVLTKGKAA